jgi:hypothetical protein
MRPTGNLQDGAYTEHRTVTGSNPFQFGHPAFRKKEGVSESGNPIAPGQGAKHAFILRPASPSAWGGRGIGGPGTVPGPPRA